jgi:hypothetical protein
LTFLHASNVMYVNVYRYHTDFPLWVFMEDYRVNFKPVHLTLNIEVIIKELTNRLSLNFAVNKVSKQLTPY